MPVLSQMMPVYFAMVCKGVEACEGGKFGDGRLAG
jgi:hypothetical protein